MNLQEIVIFRSSDMIELENKINTWLNTATKEIHAELKYKKNKSITTPPLILRPTVINQSITTDPEGTILSQLLIKWGTDWVDNSGLEIKEE